MFYIIGIELSIQPLMTIEWAKNFIARMIKMLPENVDLAFLPFANLYGRCASCSRLSSFSNWMFLKEYGLGIRLSDVPLQHCSFCDRKTVVVRAF